jgi:hypothetical protein
MALINGPSMSQAISDPQNDLATLEAEIDDDQLLVEELFLRVLNRPPTHEELEAGVTTLRAPRNEQSEIGANYEARLQQVDSALPDWIATKRFTDWSVAEPRDVASTMGATFATQPDNSLLISGSSAKGKYVVTLESRLPQITGLMIEALTDESLPNRGPGRAADGNFVVSELRITVAPRNDPLATEKIILRNAQSSFQQDGFPVKNAIDENPDTGWAIAPQLGRDHVATFAFREKIGHEGGTRIFVEIDQQHPGGTFTLGRLRLSLTTSEEPGIWPEPSLPVDITAVLELPSDQRTERQLGVLREYHRTLDEELRGLDRARDLVSNPRLMGLQDLAWALINTPAFLFNH